jgi:hypothetical protein
LRPAKASDSEKRSWPLVAKVMLSYSTKQ